MRLRGEPLRPIDNVAIDGHCSSRALGHTISCHRRTASSSALEARFRVVALARSRAASSASNVRTLLGYHAALRFTCLRAASLQNALLLRVEITTMPSPHRQA
jgi:hypothetical protein